MEYDYNAKYQYTHEWVRKEGGLFVCGITHYAQNMLSDVDYIEMPEPGMIFYQGDVFGLVESAKAAHDVLMPMCGEIVEFNEILEEQPALINSGPYTHGWMIKFKPTDLIEVDPAAEWEALITAEAYQYAVENNAFPDYEDEEEEEEAEVETVDTQNDSDNKE